MGSICVNARARCLSAKLHRRLWEDVKMPWLPHPFLIATITLCTGHSISVRIYVNIAFCKVILMVAASCFALTMPQTSVLNVFHTLSQLIESSPECYETGVMMPVWLWENRGFKTKLHTQGYRMDKGKSLTLNTKLTPENKNKDIQVIYLSVDFNQK